MLRTLALSLAMIFASQALAGECQFFARVEAENNENGEWIKVQPLNVNEFFATGPGSKKCEASLGDFGPESIFQFSQAPGAPVTTIFLVEVPNKVITEGIALFGGQAALEQAVIDAGGELMVSVEGTAIPGGLPIGMTANALFFFLPNNSLFAAPLSVVFENGISPGDPIGKVVGIGSREVICTRTCGSRRDDGDSGESKTFSNTGAVRPFYFLSNNADEESLKTTMEIEDLSENTILLTNAAVVPCSCRPDCIG